MATNEKDHAAVDDEHRNGKATGKTELSGAEAKGRAGDDDADPALDSGRHPGPDMIVKTTSGLQTIEEKPKPPDPRDVHEHDEHHGLAHTTPISLLVAVLAALLVLTIVTVAVTKVDLGSQGNLVIAMVIATIKAALVVMYFMHLRWDRKIHLVLFLGSVLFVILFLSMSITDRGEYQRSIDQLEEVQAAAAK